MFKIILSIIAFLMSLFAFGQINEIPKYKSSDVKLHNEILQMDTKYFNAYNTCDMETQADIYDEDLEFFHDKGGLSTSKSDLLKALKENICNKVTRTLIKGSVEVYPIKDYGAIQIGYHKFYNKEEPNAKSIPSKFIVIWNKKNDNWKMTKVISLHN
ncbi:MAG: nuclear transport factor 2 family protein [Polaribacter sp.]|jgi:ketosteroid isomerase-like protein|nr:nuclear transport factor 2 family protein [Polaribacter sp.]MDG1953499.1 nuclear transport factor 2 family protein [Polaribacter sp.]MDG2073835.1 nuclear transport factor 2 family protein [Polaribacter sp.]